MNSHSSSLKNITRGVGEFSQGFFAMFYYLDAHANVYVAWTQSIFADFFEIEWVLDACMS